jgi:hypothetical protein
MNTVLQVMAETVALRAPDGVAEAGEPVRRRAITLTPGRGARVVAA